MKRIFKILIPFIALHACKKPSENTDLDIPKYIYGKYTVCNMELNKKVDLDQNGISSSNLFIESRWIYDNYTSYFIRFVDAEDNPNHFPPFTITYPVQIPDSQIALYPTGFRYAWDGNVGELPRYDGKFYITEAYPNLKSLTFIGTDTIQVLKTMQLVNYSDTSTYELTMLYKKD